MINDCQITVSLPVTYDLRDHRLQRHQASVNLQKDLKAKTDCVQIDGRRLVLESLLKGVNSDVLSLGERLRSISFPHTLDSQVLERECHVCLVHLSRADPSFALFSHQIVRMGSVRRLFFYARCHYNCRSLDNKGFYNCLQKWYFNSLLGSQQFQCLDMSCFQNCFLHLEEHLLIFLHTRTWWVAIMG